MRKRKSWANKALCLLTALSVMLGLCACESKNNPANEEALVTFTDSLGRNVSVPKNPGRTAALLGSFADVWMLSGGTLIASVDDAWDDFELDMGDAVNLGGTKEPSLEKLLASDPDFVIASSATAADVKMKDTLEASGITVAYFDVTTFDDYLNMLDVLTDITGRKDLYEENGLKVKEQIEKAKEDFDIKSVPENEKSFLFLRASAGFVRAKNSESNVLGEMLIDLGFANIADSDSTLLENLSVENIIRDNPYRIFIVQMGGDEEAVKENVSRMIGENPAWNELDAVKQNRIYYMDKRLYSLKPNARWGEAYEKLIALLGE